MRWMRWMDCDDMRWIQDREENDNLEEEYCPQPEIHEKYQFNLTIDNNDDMPYEYWHVRNGSQSVREEYYIAMHRMKSELHMSDNQVEGSICISANILFGHNKRPMNRLQYTSCNDKFQQDRSLC